MDCKYIIFVWSCYAFVEVHIHVSDSNHGNDMHIPIKSRIILYADDFIILSLDPDPNIVAKNLIRIELNFCVNKSHRSTS